MFFVVVFVCTFIVVVFLYIILNLIHKWMQNIHWQTRLSKTMRLPIRLCGKNRSRCPLMFIRRWLFKPILALNCRLQIELKDPNRKKYDIHEEYIFIECVPYFPIVSLVIIGQINEFTPFTETGNYQLFPHKMSMF